MELLFEISIIVFLVAFQSLFGVGLLLFGTPIFLLLGYSFESTLALILPVSIIISLLQIIYHRKLSNNHILEFNTYCLPFLAIFLFISIYFDNRGLYTFFLADPVSHIMVIFYIYKKTTKNYYWLLVKILHI